MTILHTNDFHGGLTPERFEDLHRLRARADLYFDCGDAVTFGNVALPIAPDPVWPRLAELGCDASVPGNREFHILPPTFKAKMTGLAHEVVCTNFLNREGKPVFSPSLVIERVGQRIGVVGGMVAMVTERMAARHLTPFRFTPPVPAIADEARRIRPDVDMLIALTHIGLRRDRELAQACPEIDFILGGHSHDLLLPEKVGEVWIAQSGSHGRFAGLYEWNGKTLSGEHIPLSARASSRSRPR